MLVTHDAMIASYAKKMMYLYDGGIQSVVYKKQDSQLDFYKKINAITMQDSLLKELSTKKVKQKLSKKHQLNHNLFNHLQNV